MINLVLVRVVEENLLLFHYDSHFYACVDVLSVWECIRIGKCIRVQTYECKFVLVALGEWFMAYTV